MIYICDAVTESHHITKLFRVCNIIQNNTLFRYITDIYIQFFFFHPCSLATHTFGLFFLARALVVGELHSTRKNDGLQERYV